MRTLTVCFKGGHEECFGVPENWNPDFMDGQEWLVVPAGEGTPSIAISLPDVLWASIGTLEPTPVTNGSSAVCRCS